MSWFPVKAWFPLALNAIGLVLVGFDLARRSLDGAPVVMVVTAWATWVAWAVATGTPERHARFRAGLYLLMLAGGAFVAGVTDVVGMVPAIVALLVLFGNPAFPVRIAAAGLAGVLVDAFLVRLVLVPAVMSLFGRAAWWMPRRLGRVVPSIDLEGTGTASGSTEQTRVPAGSR